MSELWKAVGAPRPGGAMSFLGGNGNVCFTILPKAKGGHPNSFPAEKRRYQIFGAYGCALTQQLLILRCANGLRRVVDFVPVESTLDVDGWRLRDRSGKRVTLAHMIYAQSRQNIEGRPVLPLLWDRKRGLVVSNNLQDIIESLDEGFVRFARKKTELRPVRRKKRIDELTRFINKNLFENMCRLTFGEATEVSERTIHTTLAMFELQLADRPFLLGEKKTFADLVLATVLARFQYTDIPSTSLDLAQYPAVMQFERRMRQCAEFKNTWRRQSVEKFFRDSVFSVVPPKVPHEWRLNAQSDWLDRFGWHFRLNR